MESNNDLHLKEWATNNIKGYYEYIVYEKHEDSAIKAALTCVHRKAKVTIVDGDSIRYAFIKKYRVALIKSLGFTKVCVETMELQKTSGKDSVVALVTGSVHIRTSEFVGIRKFVEAFYLTHIDKESFKILNDIFIFNDDKSEAITGPDSIIAYPKCFDPFPDEEKHDLYDKVAKMGLKEPYTATESEMSVDVSDEQPDFDSSSTSQNGLGISQLAQTQPENSVDEPVNEVQSVTSVPSADVPSILTYADVLKRKAPAAGESSKARRNQRR